MIPNKLFWAWLTPSPFFNKDGDDIDEISFSSKRPTKAR